MLLSSAVDDAIEGGISTFITGMARGFDLWAAEMVLQKRKRYQQIHLLHLWPFYFLRFYVLLLSHAAVL